MEIFIILRGGKDESALVEVKERFVRGWVLDFGF